MKVIANHDSVVLRRRDSRRVRTAVTILARRAGKPQIVTRPKRRSREYSLDSLIAYE